MDRLHEKKELEKRIVTQLRIICDETRIGTSIGRLYQFSRYKLMNISKSWPWLYRYMVTYRFADHEITISIPRRLEPYLKWTRNGFETIGTNEIVSYVEFNKMLKLRDET